MVVAGLILGPGVLSLKEAVYAGAVGCGARTERVA